MARGLEMVENYTVTALFDGTADDVMKAAGFSRTMITELRKQPGLIRVMRKGSHEKTAIFATARIERGDVLFLTLPVNPVRYPVSGLVPEFAFIDEDVAVAVKPHGVATVPLRSHYGDSFASVLANAFGEYVYRPVGRLDKDTSGLIIVARNALAANRLHEAQLACKIDKRYTALADGVVPEKGRIDAPIALASDGVHREVSDTGKPAITLFERLSANGKKSLVRFTLLTGRTHQIRVHSAYIGYPLVGDKLYNANANSSDRLMLHCSFLSFPHPTKNMTVTCESIAPFSV